MKHVVRTLSVILPILLIFLLPVLGQRSGFGFTLMIALLFAFPLFALELGNMSESTDARTPLRRDGSRSDADLGRRSADNTCTTRSSTVRYRRRRVRNDERLRDHEQHNCLIKGITP